ncbi:MAG: class I SAM-dependent methyltransferase [Ruminococcus sp.]
MKYEKSEKYNKPELMAKIMGPNPVKLCEELLMDSKIKKGAFVCDLGSGQGLTSVFMAKEYGYRVCACDLWSNPEENMKFFYEMGLSNSEIIPVKADACELPFEKNFFDAVVSTDSYNYFGRDKKLLVKILLIPAEIVVSTDSYNYFGRDKEYLDKKLLPFVKKGGYVYITVPGMKKDIHDDIPEELLLSWTPEQLDYIHDVTYWKNILGSCKTGEIISVCEMESNEEVWQDWLMQENEYAVGDRKAMEAGGGKYLNFIKIVIRKK